MTDMIIRKYCRYCNHPMPMTFSMCTKCFELAEKMKMLETQLDDYAQVIADKCVSEYGMDSQHINIVAQLIAKLARNYHNSQ